MLKLDSLGWCNLRCTIQVNEAHKNMLVISGFIDELQVWEKLIERNIELKLIKKEEVLSKESRGTINECKYCK